MMGYLHRMMHKGLISKKHVLLILVFIWMAFIFYNSSLDDTQSRQDSSQIVDTILKIAVPEYEEMTAPEQFALREKLMLFVRKNAHIFEYCVLACLLYFAIGSGKNALELSFLYAISDEIHQIYVPGRSGELRDVLIDTAGAAAGIAIIWLCKRLRSRKRIP